MRIMCYPPRSSTAQKSSQNQKTDQRAEGLKNLQTKFIQFNKQNAGWGCTARPSRYSPEKQHPEFDC